MTARKSGLRQASGGAAPALGIVTRFGFGVKGLVTVLVGVLALRYALRRGGELTGQQGAVELAVGEPFGRWILAMVGAGLAGYAIWMFVVAFLDPERKGRKLTAVAERLGSFATGIAYVALALGTFALIAGHAGGGLDVKGVVAWGLTPYVGRVLVGLAGAIVMTAGVFQIRLAITRRFRKFLLPDLSRLARIVTVVSGTVGYVTLGVLSLITGWSLVQVAIRYDPSEMKEWQEALSLIAGLGRGRWLLAAAAVGLICYGLFFVLQVRYRKL